MDAVLYLIAGPARVGKSTVARMLSRRLGIGWASVDVLRDFLLPAGVRFGEDASVDGAVAQAEAFFPYLRQFAWSSCSIHGSYVLEGVYVLPAQVGALRSEGLPVRTCFLGNESMTAPHLLEHAGGFEWVRELGEEGRTRHSDLIRELSAAVRVEAARHNFSYVDMAGDFELACARVVKLLTPERLEE